MNRKIIILYGSQTGNSQDIAQRIWRRAKSFGLSSVVSSFDRFDMNNLLENNIFLVCVCSTTGQGDVPDNMSKFWKNIMKKNIPNNLFEGLKYFVIGLGDSSYEKYNFTAKKLFKRFIQIGGQSPIDICLCDEQHPNGIEGAFSPWIKIFWQTLNTDLNFDISYPKPFVHKYKVEFLDTNFEHPINQNDKLADETNPFYSRLVKNHRVTDKEHWQNVRLLEFDCNSPSIRYDPGDVLVLRPSNLEENVAKFLEIFDHLKLDLSKKIRIVSNFPNEFELDNETNENLIQTIGDLVYKYFDINSIPKQSFFELFAEISKDETEKEKLLEFLTPEGQEDLFNYVYRPRRNIFEVFYDFPNTCKNIENLETLLDLIPSIKPRSFSIASSPYVHKEKIQLLVAVVEYKTRLYETRKGTCSYWLSKLDIDKNVKIPVWIKKGSFKLDYTKPIICIGPGTGVAPFRSIINERIFKYNLAHNYLYFGCRSKSKDYYFEDEWKEICLRHDSYLSVYPAFSRDQADKIYVQDLLLKNSNEVFNLIHNLDCYILIAGNSKRMPEDVLSILKNIIKDKIELKETNQEKVEQQAEKYMNDLKIQNRLQLETWS